MARIGFVGLGNMGLPMAQNLLKAGHQVEGVDVNPASIEKLKAAGGASVETAKARPRVPTLSSPCCRPARKCARSISALPESSPTPIPGTLLIDCSTIDVETARAVAAEAEKKGLLMLDAPVSGGVGGATAATLTFMVGGSAQAFARAESLLQKMGKTIVHAGGAGNGQAAKICNNMILGVSMIAVSAKLSCSPRNLVSIIKSYSTFLQIIRPMLVTDYVLSRTGTGSDIACQSRLSSGLHRRDDA